MTRKDYRQLAHTISELFGDPVQRREAADKVGMVLDHAFGNFNREKFIATATAAPSYQQETKRVHAD